MGNYFVNNRRGHMQEDLVVKLASFGFTVNQAKVYLSIVQSGKTRVGFPCLLWTNDLNIVATYRENSKLHGRTQKPV